MGVGDPYAQRAQVVGPRGLVEDQQDRCPGPVGQQRSGQFALGRSGGQSGVVQEALEPPPGTGRSRVGGDVRADAVGPAVPGQSNGEAEVGQRVGLVFVSVGHQTGDTAPPIGYDGQGTHGLLRNVVWQRHVTTRRDPWVLLHSTPPKNVSASQPARGRSPMSMRSAGSWALARPFRNWCNDGAGYVPDGAELRHACARLRRALD